MSAPLPPDARIAVLSGAGLSAASGIPTFRDSRGLWEGHDPMQVATPEAWLADRDLVRRFYDDRRVAADTCAPNDGHRALARLQRELGPERCTLITQNIDNLLTAAGAPHVLEMHGSLFHLRCERDEGHPWVEHRGVQEPDTVCAVCGGGLRPAVVWFGEIPRYLDAIQEAVIGCDLFVSVGTSGVVYPAAGLVALASRAGARTLEVNPEPSPAPFDERVVEGSETALPRVVRTWLGAA
jgi:NAD-dependent deacetylase